MELTDTAEHTEKVETNVSVSDRPIRLKALAEGGRLVPELENRVVVAATYPDGTPAKATVKFWPGVNKIREPLVATTGENGLAEFAFTPRADWFNQSGFGEQTIEVIGQAQPVQNVGPKTELPIKLEATDATGAKAEAQSVLTGVTKGDNLVLRLNRAVFNAGQSLVAEVLVDSPVSTVYLDFIKDGQVLLSQWLDVKNGKARLEVALPQEVSGSLEVHAWQVMPTGELVRDSRLVYAQPSKDLKVEIIPSSAQYRPGEKGSVELRVTDASGKPAAAALGVLMVDEAVYALQDQQPGMEKVFFTLQKQLLEPKAQELVPGVGAPGVLIQPRVIDDQAQTRMTLGDRVDVMQVGVFGQQHDGHTGLFRRRPYRIHLALDQQRPHRRTMKGKTHTQQTRRLFQMCNLLDNVRRFRVKAAHGDEFIRILLRRGDHHIIAVPLKRRRHQHRTRDTRLRHLAEQFLGGDRGGAMRFMARRPRPLGRAGSPDVYLCVDDHHACNSLAQTEKRRV
jgi:hypothetical protein